MPLHDVGPPPEGSYYHFHIIDMDVWNEDGEHLGKVTRILPTGGRDVYVISGGPDGELLIPAAATMRAATPAGYNAAKTATIQPIMKPERQPQTIREKSRTANTVAKP